MLGLLKASEPELTVQIGDGRNIIAIGVRFTTFCVLKATIKWKRIKSINVVWPC